MSKASQSQTDCTTDSLNIEKKPVEPVIQQAPPCVLCKWFEKRLNNTLKEQINHMEKYHVEKS